MGTHTMGCEVRGISVGSVAITVERNGPHHPSIVCPTIPGEGYAHPHTRYPHAASAKRRRAPVSIGSNVA